MLQHPSQLCQLHPRMADVCATDIFTLEGVNYLIRGNFCSKMILIRHLPSSQSNTIKVILLLKKTFSEHGILEVLFSDNGPQYASAQFTDFCTSWSITQETLSPHYPESNGFAEAYVKSVKHALQCASTAVPIHSSPSWHSKLHQSMPSSHHLLSSCIITSLGPPFLPKSATLTQQPSKFVNGFIPTPMPSRHRQINTTNDV